MVSIIRADPIHAYWMKFREPISAASLIQFIKNDLSWSAIVDGEVACIWGVQITGMTGARIWLVTSEIVEKKYILFLRESRKFVDAALRAYHNLHCYVDSRFDKSIQWLEWLGFEIADKMDFANMTLYRYELRGT